jgi:hypothetical protein
MTAKSNEYRVSVGKPLEGRRRRRRKNIKMDIREVERVCTGLVWLRIETTGGHL